MDESVREALNFLLVAVGKLAVASMVSALLLPSWLHGNLLFATVAIVGTVAAAHRAVYSGTIAELGLSPLPPESDDAADAAPERPTRVGKTPKERVEGPAEE